MILKRRGYNGFGKGRCGRLKKIKSVYKKLHGEENLDTSSKITTNVEAKLGKGVEFERIRRITGYLVGTLDRFNDAKRAEEHDRIKHGM